MMFLDLRLALLALSFALAASAMGEEAPPAKPAAVGYRRMEFAFDTAGEKRTRQLDLWYPTSDEEKRHNYRGQLGLAAEDGAVAPGAHPLVIFSHGFLGTSDQTIFLTEACARAGYIVAAMNHADSLTNRGTEKREAPRFAEFAKWTDEKYRDRRDDIVALLDQLLEWNASADSPWQGRIDAKQIGGMGHSLGGYTMLGLAGGWQSWREPRLKAVVLLSPFAQPYDVNGQLDKVAIPVQLQGGTLDFGISPALPAIYKKLDCTKSYLVLKNETHFGWTNFASLNKSTTECCSSGNPELIVRYSLAFLDQHLQQRNRADILEKADPKLDSYRFEKR